MPDAGDGGGDERGRSPARVIRGGIDTRGTAVRGATGPAATWQDRRRVTDAARPRSDNDRGTERGEAASLLATADRRGYKLRGGLGQPCGKNEEPGGVRLSARPPSCLRMRRGTHLDQGDEDQARESSRKQGTELTARASG